ncbi:hypothetical protein [Paenibacillus sp. GCM10028914]|uniref:hypothetical protein n=1 Tax=Paenibacillus sp. GCM10028914 TaxID=3273416 RepID=UPI00362036EF
MSQLTIERADMRRDEENNFVGYAVFTMEGQAAAYEITFLSKNGKDWDYSLNFAGESGPEEDFLKVDALIEENDDLFDDLLDAAIDAGGFEA